MTTYQLGTEYGTTHPYESGRMGWSPPVNPLLGRVLNEEAEAAAEQVCEDCGQGFIGVFCGWCGDREAYARNWPSEPLRDDEPEWNAEEAR